MQDVIERTQWIDYFKSFNKRNKDRPTRLETFGELGAQEAEQHLPLSGINVELEGGDDAPYVEIMLGSLTPQVIGHLTHTVQHVERIMCRLGEDAREDAVEFESSDGEKTLLTFEHPSQLPPAFEQ